MTEKPAPTLSNLNQDYFEGCAQGELRIRRCLTCDTRFRFAHDWCPNCWSFELGWERASGQGKVSHFTVVYQAPSQSFAEIAPYVLAMVELPEGIRMMSNIVGCDPLAVYIGLDVIVAFERRGEVTIPIFRPRSPP